MAQLTLTSNSPLVKLGKKIQRKRKSTHGPASLWAMKPFLNGHRNQEALNLSASEILGRTPMFSPAESPFHLLQQL